MVHEVLTTYTSSTIGEATERTREVSSNSYKFYVMQSKISLLTAFLVQYFYFASCFVQQRMHFVHKRSVPSYVTSRDSMIMNSSPSPKRALLDSSTLWRISITLNKSGFKSIDCIARVRFVEDRNYEPPQGRIFVEDDFNGLIKVDEKGYAGSWTLSEDKDDRKDGLWIWGLFQEPKYPFLYFSLGKFFRDLPFLEALVKSTANVS